ncbi:hypothetical protein FQN52_008196 [Onygenales sp. PD_12]|nr:hypothetical protein FQN52_008196 [Onygenales sp. PD_12]
MSSVKTQPPCAPGGQSLLSSSKDKPAALDTVQVVPISDDEESHGTPKTACKHCVRDSCLKNNIPDQEPNLNELLKSLIKGQELLLKHQNPSDGNNASDPAPSPEEIAKQEATITRVPLEEWRSVKTGPKIDIHQSVLLVSSKAGARAKLRKPAHLSPKPARDCANATKENLESLGIPYRLAINSPYLLDVLSQCTGETFTESRNVLVRPFKYLVGYESEIRQFAEDTQSAYSRAKDELAKISPETTVGEGRDQELQKSANENQIDVTTPDKVVEEPVPVAAACNGTDQELETPEGEKDFINETKATYIRLENETQQLRCLLEFMDRDMRDIFDAKRHISDNSLEDIAFEHLWLLYKPGDLVLRSSPEQPNSRCQAYRILSVTGGRMCFDRRKDLSWPYPEHVRDRGFDSASESEEKARDAVNSAGDERTCFIIDAFYNDFDGVIIGPRSRRFVISPYNGVKPIHSLNPARWLPDLALQEMQEMLIQRGRRFLQLASGTHRKYSGTTIQEANQTTKYFNNYIINQAELHGEIMVDQKAGVDHFREKFDNWRKSFRFWGGAIAKSSPPDKRELFDPFPIGKNYDRDEMTDIFDDSKFEEDRQNDFRESTDLLNSRPLDPQQIPVGCIMLLPPRAYAYGLLDHKWFALDVNLVKDLPLSQERMQRARFEDLVLPDGHRTLLQALIKNQVRAPKGITSDSDDAPANLTMDAVPGKGRGLIILLHGAPGVGKTSTAECVAAQLNRPLLPITCGDIGTTAHDAEKELETYCSLAHRWRCVLLLDEADVFLAKREKGDIKRNSLVSVFLRVLEYYSGVIILTTNRVGEFDEAFRSRIHISLYYPKLDEISTKEVWEKNVRHVENSRLDIDIEADKVLRFADKHWQENKYKPSRRWNGRQIKNAFHAAIALANWDFHEGKASAGLSRPLVKAKHFRSISLTSAHFDDYISDIHGIQEDDTYAILAERDEIRKDSHAERYSRQAMRESSPRRNPTMRHGINRRNTGLQNRNYDYYDDDDDVEDESSNEVKRLQLELKLAKLKGSRGSTSKSKVRPPPADDDEDEEPW